MTTVVLSFAALTPRAAAAVMASVNTRMTDEADPALWGAALSLETAAHRRLNSDQQDAIYLLDRFLTAFAGMVATDTTGSYSARCVVRLGGLL